MAGKNLKNQKQIKSADEAVSRRQKVSQYLFAVFALLIIISMVVSAFATY
jgi:hypothetical protein